MQYIPIIFLAVILFVIGIEAIILKSEEKNEKKVKENDKKIIENAEKTKADARTGDHSADIKYMADKLHQYNK